MKDRWPTIEQLRNSACAPLNPALLATDKKPEKQKRSKYNAKKTEVDDIVFDSTREANRYKELKLLLKAGHIGLLQRQVEYELNEGGQYSYKYIADFVYLDTLTGNTIVEDCKGFRTAEYRKKKRLMWKVHKIKILET
jgi:hypothetical protein